MAYEDVPKPHRKPPTSCPYCAGGVILTTQEEVYGRNYSEWPYLYICTTLNCRASVGVHPGTFIPLGNLASKELREARVAAKEPFQKLWLTIHGNRINRNRAYWKLAEHLGISKDKCHFGMFDLNQCAKAKAWANKMLVSLNRADEIV